VRTGAPTEKENKMSDQAEFMHQGRLNGSQRNKVKGLFNMLYTPQEFAEEIGINKEQVYRVYVPAGCPVKRDKQNHILINGKDFKTWYETHYKKLKLEKGQAYCVSCKKAVQMINAERFQKGNLVYYSANCPKCGKKIIRFIDGKRKKNDQQEQLETD
jgi:predicted RNA-binding Zn-ribbon protein involved in translation (DUF1610 family)